MSATCSTLASPFSQLLADSDNEPYRSAEIRPRSASAIRSSRSVNPRSWGGERGNMTAAATFYSFTARRTVDSATERSLPGTPGQVTVTATFHRRTAMAVAALSRSGVDPEGVYGEIDTAH